MKFKRGDTFDFGGQAALVDANDAPISLAGGWTARSHVRFPDCNRSEVLVVTLQPSGAIRLVCEASKTQSWPVGIAEVDVEFQAPTGEIVSTETVRFSIVEDVTRV